MKMRGFCISVLLVMMASPAVAQNQYTRQVISQLDGMESRAVGTGKPASSDLQFFN
jgi:hypothetical protein